MNIDRSRALRALRTEYGIMAVEPVGALACLPVMLRDCPELPVYNAYVQDVMATTSARLCMVHDAARQAGLR